VQSTVYDWQPVAQLLTATRPGEAVTRVHPAPELRQSLLAALSDQEIAACQEQLAAGAQIATDLNKLIQQLAIFEQFSRCPILGITGLLNSGKSSLLATYLSNSGRRRVLRGLSNTSGTHRFVLWMPERWRDEPELVETLFEFLTQLFGHPFEILSDDPELATRQYNGRLLAADRQAEDPLEVPLVAYDTALDDLRMGLLDCPDIQTGFCASSPAVGATERGTQMAIRRQRQLASVGRLCSAFVVMAKLNSLHDHGLIDVLTTLRDAMPGVPRILAVNRVKARYSPEVVAGEARALIDRFGMRNLFMAYDFRSSLAHTRIPPMPPGLQPEEDGSLQPIFFEVPASNFSEQSAAAASPHESKTPPKYLYHLAQQLDPGSLAKESCRSLVLQLRSRSLEAIDWHLRNPSIRGQQIADARLAIAQACYDFMAQRDASGNVVGLRLQTSPAIIAQLSDSLHRTAPFWLRPSLAIDRTARQLQQAVAGKLEKFWLIQNASRNVAEFAKRFRRGEGAQVMTPERLGRVIREMDRHDSLKPLAEHELLDGCRLALERFAAEEQSVLDQKMLDEWGRAVWKQMNWKDQLKRGVQPLALATGPLLAALLIPFDGGGTAVLVFASAQELLAAAGIAAVLTPIAGGGETLSIIQEETPWRQLSNLFAILCDSLGLPRAHGANLPRCGTQSKAILDSQVTVQTTRPATTLSVWQPDEGVIVQLQSALDRLQ
jgi:hypothetical protein